MPDIAAPFPANGQEPWGDSLRAWGEQVEDVINDGRLSPTQQDARFNARIFPSIEPPPARSQGGFGPPSGTLCLARFPATQTRLWRKIFSYTNTAATAGVATCRRMGVYRQEPDLTWALIAATAHDQSLWIANNVEYMRNLTTPASLVAGNWYATAVLSVQPSGTSPSYRTADYPFDLASGYPGNTMFRGLGRSVISQTDLPATLVAGTWNDPPVACLLTDPE